MSIRTTGPAADDECDNGKGVTHHDRRWSVLAVVLTGQVTILLEATIMNVALPSARADLNASGTTSQWVLTAYFLAFGSLLPLGGRLADTYGRRTMFVWGLVGVALSSALGGAAPDMVSLIAARAVQGGCAALLAPAALSLIVVTFSDTGDLGKAFAIFGAVAGGAGAAGLLLGGVLTEDLTWRWCMYVNVAFAVPAVIGGLALLRNSAEPVKPELPWASTVVGTGAIFLLVFGSSQAETRGWASATTVTSLLAGGVLLSVFVVLQRLERNPLIPLRILHDRNRGAAYLALFLSYAAVFALFLLLTYYFQDVEGYSPIQTGIAFLPLPFSVGIVAWTTQRFLIQRLPLRAILVGGLLASSGGAALLSQAGAPGSFVTWVVPGLVLVGVGLGTAGVVSTAVGQMGLASHDAGVAGAVTNVSQQLGAALGVAVISTLAATAARDFSTGPGRSGSDPVDAAVHGFAVGHWAAAGVFAVAAAACGVLARRGARL